jgi:hypothetical protein
MFCTVLKLYFVVDRFLWRHKKLSDIVWTLPKNIIHFCVNSAYISIITIDCRIYTESKMEMFKVRCDHHQLRTVWARLVNWAAIFRKTRMCILVITDLNHSVKSFREIRQYHQGYFAFFITRIRSSLIPKRVVIVCDIATVFNTGSMSENSTNSS